MMRLSSHSTVAFRPVAEHNLQLDGVCKNTWLVFGYEISVFLQVLSAPYREAKPVQCISFLETTMGKELRLQIGFKKMISHISETITCIVRDVIWSYTNM